MITLSVSRTRPRADTSTLLGKLAESLPLEETSSNAPIVPLETIYTDNRLRLGLFFAVRRLHRNISPRAEIFLGEYKDSIKKA